MSYLKFTWYNNNVITLNKTIENKDEFHHLIDFEMNHHKVTCDPVQSLKHLFFVSVIKWKVLPFLSIEQPYKIFRLDNVESYNNAPNKFW